MSAVQIVREEILRVGAQMSMPLEKRRLLVNIAKTARKQGENPRSAVSRAMMNSQK